MQCDYCKKIIDDKAETTCPKCGAPLTALPDTQRETVPAFIVEGGQAVPISPLSKTVAIQFGLFSGLFGAHLFYLGYSKKGLLRLTLTLANIVLLFIRQAPGWMINILAIAIWGLVDVVRISTGSLKDSQGRTLR